MNKKLPYEEALEKKLQELPKPGEEASWQAMSKLLDKNNNRRGFAYWKNLFMFLLLPLLLLTGFWLLLRNNEPVTKSNTNKNNHAIISQDVKNKPAHIENQKAGKDVSGSTSTTQNNSGPSEKSIEPVLNASTNNEKNTRVEKNKTNATIISQGTSNPGRNKNNNPSPGDIASNTKDETGIYAVKPPKNTLAGNDKSQQTATSNLNDSRINKRSYKGKYGVDIHSGSVEDSTRQETDEGKTDIETAIASKEDKKELNSNGKLRIEIEGNVAEDEKEKNDPVDLTQNLLNKNAEKISYNPPQSSGNNNEDSIKAIVLPEAITTILKDSTGGGKKNDVHPFTKTGKKDQKKNAGMIWSAGIGIRQQIGMGNQKHYNYGFNGEKNFFNDYLPSVYLRWEKPKKWYAQAEFNYALPYMLVEIPYSLKSTWYADANNFYFTDIYLKKTYHHEISLSYNYYLKPGWTVGGGMIYSRLYRSISEQQTSIRNWQTLETKVETKIISKSTADSALSKSNLMLMIQTDYQWRRMSVGTRFSMDLLPYIKYKLPTGEMEKRKNWAFEFFLRFRIF